MCAFSLHTSMHAKKECVVFCMWSWLISAARREYISYITSIDQRHTRRFLHARRKHYWWIINSLAKALDREDCDSMIVCCRHWKEVFKNWKAYRAGKKCAWPFSSVLAIFFTDLYMLACTLGEPCCFIYFLHIYSFIHSFIYISYLYFFNLIFI